jgi:hypothetical protein
MDKTILLSFQTIRKCSICKEYITLEKDLSDTIYYGTTPKNKTIQHKKCLKKKMFSKKGNKLTEGDIDILIDDLFKDGIGHLEGLIYKNHLYLLLMKHYDIITLPNYIFTKMEQIFKGEFKKMNKPVPPEHLLDMWQKKMSFLDGLYHKEKMDGVSRINYDLAVLIAKYPSYLDWMGKKNSDKKMIEERSREERVSINLISKINSNEKEEDIFSDIN